MTRLFPLLVLLAFCLSGCHTRSGPEVVVYCGVSEAYAGPVFDEFEKQTGIHVAARYDIESSKSVGLAGKLEAERAYPQADVWWGSEPFLSVRLAGEGLLKAYRPPTAADVPDAFKDDRGCWTGVALRARVLAVAQGSAAPPFAITGLADMADPRLRGRVAMARPTAGTTGAHLAALYVAWGPQQAEAFLARLHDNGIALLGGNAEVAIEVGKGTYALGLTDSDAIPNARDEGGTLAMVVPDQQGETPLGTLAMPTTVGLVAGAKHEEPAKRLIDFLASKEAERRLLDAKFAQWSVREGGAPAGPGAESFKAMKVDYRAAAGTYARAQQEGTAILEGRTVPGR